MTRTGGVLVAARRASSRHAGALAFGLAAAFGVAMAWGFSVDDALISARVAHHLARGLGYRFNAEGPVVDCVTPLGWAFVLAPAAGQGAWQAMTWASVSGAGLWVVAAAALGRRCRESCSGARLVCIALVLAACLPLAAWAVSGMETGLIMALGVAALARGAPGAACAGMAAALRPELTPWAVTLALGTAIARRESLPRCALALALALTPALFVAAIRSIQFGQPAPLAVFAKPSDSEHGLRYSLGALLLSGPPYLLLAGSAWRSLSREHWAIALAIGVHWLVLVGVGGDWMPFWRLAMPALPGVFFLGAALAERSRVAPNVLRWLAALTCGGLLHVAKGSDTRAVRTERLQMLGALAPLLAGAENVATLDVGWVGAAGPYHLIDLAGVTDEQVAFLPGGHTSKRLPMDFLERRGVDALVLLLAPEQPPSPPEAPGPLRFARQVEQRSARLRGAQQFTEVGRVRLNPRQQYVVLRRGPAPFGTASSQRRGPTNGSLRP